MMSDDRPTAGGRAKESAEQATGADQNMIHTGGCHCGAVRYEVRAPAHVTAYECNCSICEMVGYQHFIVARDRFMPVHEPEALTTYTFNSHVAQHYFCNVCGVKAYYVPRSHPTGVSVNARTLDADAERRLTLAPFDGRNWEKNVASIR